jgi:signal transduction histidine kinase
MPRAAQVAAATRAFFMESRSPFEMTHRGYREANAALRRLNERLDEEAQRIAHALHDEAAQLLATVHVALACCPAVCAVRPAPARGDSGAARPGRRRAEGRTTKEVASLLGVSVKTAESHRTNVMQKLGVHETASLVRYAVRRGLIEP